MVREVNSGEELYRDEWYCRAADDAIEWIWWADPAFPGMKTTGSPRYYLVRKDKGEDTEKNALGYPPT